MDVDGYRSRLVAGQTVHVPAVIMHSRSNGGEAAGRRIVIFAPAGMEHLFLEAGAPEQDTEPDAATTLAAAIQHGWEFISRCWTNGECRYCT